MYVMSPFTSLLVLENDEMYTQFNVDRGRKDHWVLYACPEKIEVATESQHRWSAVSPHKSNELVALPTFQAPVANALVANPAVFSDLLSHAPGLNTSRADVLAVMKKETPADREGISNFKSQISNAKQRHIDDAARSWIEKARGRGWESIVLPGGNGEAGITIQYDQAKGMLKRINDNSWQPRFSNTVQQSRNLMQSF